MKDYNISIEKIKVLNGQDSIKYYRCELSYKGDLIMVQFHSSFTLTVINNIKDAIKLVSSCNSKFGEFQSKLFIQLLINENIDFSFEVDDESVYVNDYGRFNKLK